MTKEEAIHIIKNINANTNCDNCFYKYDATCEDCRVETALNMAIEALENQKILKEELEKIKAEIQKEDKYNPEIRQTEYMCGTHQAYENVISIIDRNGNIYC